MVSVHSVYSHFMPKDYFWATVPVAFLLCAVRFHKHLFEVPGHREVW